MIVSFLSSLLAYATWVWLHSYNPSVGLSSNWKLSAIVIGCSVLVWMTIIRRLEGLVDEWTLGIRQTAVAIVGFCLGAIIGIFGSIFLSYVGLGNLFGDLAYLVSFVMVCLLGYFSAKLLIKYEENLHIVVLFERCLKGIRLIKVVDTSAIIDGRILGLVENHFIDDLVLVPECVVMELQKLVDSEDDRKKEKGTQGLSVYKQLLSFPIVRKYAWHVESGGSVDGAIVNLAKKIDATIVTLDAGMIEVAKAESVACLNIHALAGILKMRLRVGDIYNVTIIKKGKQTGQGLAYTEDGTMVVVSNAADKVGQKMDVVIDNMIESHYGVVYFATGVDDAENSQIK